MPRLPLGLFAFAALALFACAGCGSTAPRQAKPAAELPLVDGLAVYDMPIAEADPEIRELWASARAILDAPAPRVPEDPSARQAWLTENLRPWIEERGQRLAVLREKSAALVSASDATPRRALFASILHAASFAHTVDQVLDAPGLEHPEVPEVAEVYRQTLTQLMAPLATSARESFARCAALAPRAPKALQHWGAECERRATALAEVARSDSPPSGDVGDHRTRSGTGSLPARRPDPPRQCQTDATWKTPEAPAPDETTPRRVAIVYDGDRLEGRAREKLLRAMSKKLGAVLDTPILPRRAVRKAESLHQQRRLRPEAPACGQAPPLPAILAVSHPNLVLATVSTDCYDVIGDDERTRCALSVRFRRAGTEDRSGLSGRLQATLEEHDPQPRDWIRAARQLGPPETGGLGGILARGSYFSITGFEDEDPWLRIPATLTDLREPLTSCQPAQGVVAVEASWDISPVGETGAVDARAAATSGPADGDAVASCVADVLRDTPWPCTPSGQTEKARVTICVGP